MATIKLTKNALRDQEKLLKQLQRYLPTLQLKKAMLQAEVYEAKVEISALKQQFDAMYGQASTFSALLTEKSSIDIYAVAVVETVHKRYENIAGVEVPHFESVDFSPVEYSLFDTPAWVDSAIDILRKLAEISAKKGVVIEKLHALEEELRQVSIRVNLFEKVLIPRCMKNIKKIKVFLGDQQLSAVGQIKVAKAKIEENKMRVADAS